MFDKVRVSGYKSDLYRRFRVDFGSGITQTKGRVLGALYGPGYYTTCYLCFSMDPGVLTILLGRCLSSFSCPIHGV